MTSPTDDDLVLEVDGLRYALDTAPTPSGHKVVASVRLQDTDTSPLRDRVDLYAFRGRHGFARLVADHFGREVAQVMGHLACLLDQVERAHTRQAVQPPDALTPARRLAAETLLAQPHLLDLAADAMEALGYVGEAQTKRLGYLVATSRLLRRPLSAILLASSGCGKTELLETLAKLLPPESVELLSRISPAALYYAGPEHLRHKLVLVDEQAGTAEADYAVRTLQSRGLLRLAVPVRGKTEPFTVYGPISLMSGTTSTTLNPENLSRCLSLTLDDSPAQTRRVQEAQRAAWAGEGPPELAQSGRQRRGPRRARPQSGVDLQVWQDLQRLLAPTDVLIPFARQLRFPARTTHDRRGNQKLLGLVAAHALLAQARRERDPRGRVVASPDDYRVVHDLLVHDVAQQVEGLSPRASRLYRALGEREAPAPLARRDAAALLGWGYNTAKRALDELVEQELVTVADRGPPARYRLLDRSVLGTAAELTDPGRLP